MKSYDGRPIKIEGNPEHPLNRRKEGEPRRPHAGTDALTQASILDLYDPDRAHRFTHNGESVSREKALDALASLGQAAEATQGQGLCFLIGRNVSPSVWRLTRDLRAKFPQARGFIHEPVDFDIHRQAASLAFGAPVRPVYHLDQASRVLALDCDFLGAEEDAWHLTRGFAKGRKIQSAAGGMSRLYAVEAVMSLTGANADHRLRLPASRCRPSPRRVARRWTSPIMAGAVPDAGQFVAGLREIAKSLSAEARAWASACVKDLAANPGQSVVMAGYRQPLAVHLLAHALNFHLQAVGKTVTCLPEPDPMAGTIGDLAKALQAGEVETLVILGGNPAFTAPADLDWPVAQKKAKTVVRLGSHEDETSLLSHWHLPQAHYLEALGRRPHAR